MISIVTAPKCLYCDLKAARPGLASCSDLCQRYLDCEDPDCPCNTDKCVVCMADIAQGEITCSQNCDFEADTSWKPADYDAIMYPHGR